tara:strand:+ start:676 stop:1392 length:717 start_codon:yes stop_codon:yes gene_type:complete
MKLLKVGNGNTKLSTRNIIDLPAGISCPKSKICRSWVTILNGKTRIADGQDTLFRCYAASQEAQYPNVHKKRLDNLKLLLKALRRGNAVELIDKSINKNLKLTRFHSSGDFFSPDYALACLRVAELNPNNIFYAYTKSNSFFLDVGIPSNFHICPSWGGIEDHLIPYFDRSARVVFNEDEANRLGLPIDHDDSLCMQPGDHCHLLHGTQPKGSKAGKELAIRKKAKKTDSTIFTGYSK